MARKRKRLIRESPSSISSIYLSPSYKEVHEKFFSEKKVISERFIDYESFPCYPIQKCFSGKNMITNFLHLKDPAPLNPVRLFYSQIHMFSEEGQSFQTFVRGKTHKITPDVIATLLGLVRPSKAVPSLPTSEDELIVSKDKFRRAVYLRQYRDKPHNRCEIKTTHLKPIINVLVKICQFNILPKASHYNKTNLETVYLSYLLLHGYPVDISSIIWRTMASVGRNRARSSGVPYGIIVGRLLSYLGHPFPADTPCADVPIPLDLKVLRRAHLPRDPCYFKNGPPSGPRSHNISPHSPDDDDHHSVLPFSIEPTFPDSSASFDQRKILDSMQSIQHTMGIILFRFEQQSEMIDRLARQQDHLAQCQARYHSILMQYFQRADPDQVKPICQKCGDTGYSELLIYCNMCRIYAQHRYCLDKIPESDDNEVIWSCDECEQIARLRSQQGLLATSPEKVNEDKSNSGKKRKIKY